MDIWDHKLYRLDLAKGPESLKTIDTDAAIGYVACFSAVRFASRSPFPRGQLESYTENMMDT